jgi:hypothetical protein
VAPVEGSPTFESPLAASLGVTEPTTSTTTYASLVIAITIPASTNTTIATCIQTQ